MQVNIQFTATLPVKIIKKSKYYIASCAVLDVHSQGDTKKEAKTALGEALSLFFISCYERGTLDAVLKQCGFKSGRKTLSVSTKPNSGQDWIKVPIPFIVNQSSEAACHV